MIAEVRVEWCWKGGVLRPPPVVGSELPRPGDLVEWFGWPHHRYVVSERRFIYEERQIEGLDYRTNTIRIVLMEVMVE